MDLGVRNVILDNHGKPSGYSFPRSLEEEPEMTYPDIWNIEPESAHTDRIQVSEIFDE